MCRYEMKEEIRSCSMCNHFDTVQEQFSISATFHSTRLIFALLYTNEWAPDADTYTCVCVWKWWMGGVGAKVKCRIATKVEWMCIHTGCVTKARHLSQEYIKLVNKWQKRSTRRRRTHTHPVASNVCVCVWG